MKLVHGFGILRYFKEISHLEGQKLMKAVIFLTKDLMKHLFCMWLVTRGFVFLSTCIEKLLSMLECMNSKDLVEQAVDRRLRLSSVAKMWHV